MRRHDRDNLGNTLTMAAIAAVLSYMAFGSFWHAGLFGFLAFAINAVGNRVIDELRKAG
jgi:hypothetical protein